MAVAGDGFELDRDPFFTGTESSIRETFDTLRDARNYGNDLATGQLDPFLGDTWHRITISRPRNPDGTFAPGWVVQVDYQRPGPGDASGDVGSLPEYDGEMFP